MIYGLVPIGGLGTRLSLTFSKEMLPQKGFRHFNPISNHLVAALIEAGAEKIVFIHGFELKNDVVTFFKSINHLHFVQKSAGFSNVLKEFLTNISLQSNDKVLFGMPDTVFRGNPFHEMLLKQGIACGLFTTNEDSEVDRLYINEKKFAVKKVKSPLLQNMFWGLLKFDGSDLVSMENQGHFLKYSEIGDIINQYNFSCVEAEDYLDIGTWDNYNEYLKNY